MNQLLTNLRYAARNGQAVEIGGGMFSAAEIRKAVAQVDELVELLGRVFRNSDNIIQEEGEVRGVLEKLG